MDEEKALRLIVEGTAAETGEGFFKALVGNLASVLGTRGAWVTEYLPEAGHLSSLAFRLDDGWVDEYEYKVSGTPCEVVIDRKTIFRVEDNVVDLYPGDPDLAEYEVQSNDDRDVTSPFRLFRLGITKGQPKARGYYDRWAAKS